MQLSVHEAGKGLPDQKALHNLIMKLPKKMPANAPIQTVHKLALEVRAACQSCPKALQMLHACNKGPG